MTSQVPVGQTSSTKVVEDLFILPKNGTYLKYIKGEKNAQIMCYIEYALHAILEMFMHINFCINALKLSRLKDIKCCMSLI